MQESHPKNILSSYNSQLPTQKALKHDDGWQIASNRFFPSLKGLLYAISYLHLKKWMEQLSPWIVMKQPGRCEVLVSDNKLHYIPDSSKRPLDSPNGSHQQALKRSRLWSLQPCKGGHDLKKLVVVFFFSLGKSQKILCLETWPQIPPGLWALRCFTLMGVRGFILTAMFGREKRFPVLICKFVQMPYPQNKLLRYTRYDLFYDRIFWFGYIWSYMYICIIRIRFIFLEYNHIRS